MKTFEYVNASSLESALSLLNHDNNSLALAGGTDLVTEMRLGIVAPERLVNLKTIPDLKGIRFDEKGGLKIGALTTLDEIATHEVVKERYPVLVEAISNAASPQLRNRGTIAGNLCQDSRCWYYRGQFRCWLKGGETCYARDGENAHHAIFSAGPCHTVYPSDPATALMALDVSVHILGLNGLRILPLEGLFQRPHEGARRLIILRPTEIITEIVLSAPRKGSRGKFIKAMERRVWSFALASVAVQVALSGNKIRDARVVFGGVALKPWRMQNIEAILHNTQLDNETIDHAVSLAGEQAEPLIHNSFKVKLIKGILKEALADLSN